MQWENRQLQCLSELWCFIPGATWGISVKA
jgi:hypothetical protein